MPHRRTFMSLFLVFLLIIPILSFASVASERDRFDNKTESLNRMLLEAREREVSQLKSRTESLSDPIITKAFIAYDSINNRYLSVY